MEADEIPVFDLKLEPTGLQAAFINSPADETLYGGARGGGKTFAVIIDWLIHSDAHGKYARGIVFRRTLVELDDFIEAARDVLESAGHKWNEGKKYFRSPQGAIFRCRYLEDDNDARKYQGHAYSRVYVEEIGNFPSEAPVRMLLGCLRPPYASGPPIRCQLKATANPGGPGQTWVKARFIDPAPAMTPFSEDHGKRYKIFIPAKLTDNPHLMKNDPGYRDRLADAGSAELVKAWLDGDWNTVVGQYFREYDKERHVIPTVQLPAHWKIRYRSMDWGSARPSATYWFAVADGGDLPGVDTHIPRGALVVYRERYGWNGKPNQGERKTAREVAQAILALEEDHAIVDGNYELNKIDPATFATNGGPSIAEEMAAVGIWFKRADNRRVAGTGPIGGWDQVRKRLKGEEGFPMIFFMDCCHHLTRTLPMIPTDPVNLDDVDSDSEDHAADALRYGCMARPYQPPPPPPPDSKNKPGAFGQQMTAYTLDDAWKTRVGGSFGTILRN